MAHKNPNVREQPFKVLASEAALALAVVAAAVFLSLLFSAMALADEGDTLATAAIRHSERMPKAAPAPADALLEHRLVAVNARFNALRQASDFELWGRADYWATPVELQDKGAGDCEDFAIAKYFELMAEGVPEARLRLMLAGLYRPAQGRIEMHMVLAYYPTPSADPLVLDNVDDAIRPLSKRADLAPRIAFNRTAWWAMQGAEATPQSGPAPLSRWQDVLQRVAGAGEF